MAKHTRIIVLLVACPSALIPEKKKRWIPVKEKSKRRRQRNGRHCWIELTIELLAHSSVNWPRKKQLQVSD